MISTQYCSPGTKLLGVPTPCSWSSYQRALTTVYLEVLTALSVTVAGARPL